MCDHIVAVIDDVGLLATLVTRGELLGFAGGGPVDEHWCLAWFPLRTQMDAQAMMLETLKCTTDILDEHQIPYFIDTGTLLGAIRHGGFISPEDREDVDIGILREDEPKLLELKDLTWQRCGFPMIHRTGTRHMLGLPVLPRRRGRSVSQTACNPGSVARFVGVCT